MPDVQVSRYPAYEADLFSVAALQQPFGHYRAMRALGPVVRLPAMGVLALTRFDGVQAALRAPDILISGKGTGFNDTFNSPGPEPNLITSDGPRHRKIRAHLTRPMMPGALKRHRAMLKTMIADRVRSLVGADPFDAVESLAKHLPLAAIAFLVGLPDEGRANMLRWASAIFNMVGPYTPQLERDLETMKEFRRYLVSVDPAHLAEESWARGLFEAEQAGTLTMGEARAALSGLIAPSLDTTVNAKSNLLYNLASNPDQWRLLKDHPALIPSAVVEGVRHSATVRWFARHAVANYEAGDVFVPEGTRVMLMFGSANRDERHYDDPDAFRAARNPQDQLGWGTGPHICGGMHLAKLEMEVLLEALVEHVDDLEAGQPVLGTNRGLYGFDSLPMRLRGSVAA